ncbi:hypothetical protein SESBI_11915 [Sesbania bispinosa]|nr:hypothetical protein SESBI_11915 [Sesbania bispinosa]
MGHKVGACLGKVLEYDVYECKEKGQRENNAPKDREPRARDVTELLTALSVSPTASASPPIAEPIANDPSRVEGIGTKSDVDEHVSPPHDNNVHTPSPDVNAK